MTRRLELGTTKQGVGAGVRCLGWGCRCIKGRDEANSIIMLLNYVQLDLDDSTFERFFLQGCKIA